MMTYYREGFDYMTAKLMVSDDVIGLIAVTRNRIEFPARGEEARNASDEWFNRGVMAACKRWEELTD